MTTNLIGTAVKRREDYRFLTGSGTYTDDVKLDRQTYAIFVRSPHAHAKIISIDTSKAKQAPGVVAVFTGQDTADAKINGLPCGWLITDVDGQPMKEPPHPCSRMTKFATSATTSQWSSPRLICRQKMRPSSWK